MSAGEKILSIIRIKGPVLPTQLTKELNTDTIMVSAMLSELVSKGKLKLSNLKVGSSPLYYTSGQEPRLLGFLSHLNEKDRRACELLREKKVLRDTIQDPLVRVSLRQIKDFAVPLQVTLKDEKEIFWRWFLLSNNEAEEIIKNLLGLKKPKEEETKEKPVEKPLKKERPKKQETQEKLAEAKEPRKQEKPIDVAITDPFLKKLKKFFDETSIKIIEQTAIRKKTEYDFILELGSAVGSLVYYCKAKNKKRIGEADLSNAYVKGQIKKLPVLFLSPGELTKAAKELAEKELKGIVIKKL